jgi:hypothetical protein
VASVCIRKIVDVELPVVIREGAFDHVTLCHVFTYILVTHCYGAMGSFPTKLLCAQRRKREALSEDAGTEALVRRVVSMCDLLIDLPALDTIPWVI